MDLSSLKVKIFADGADKAGMLEMARMPWIRGFTTNPTLMRKAGITDFEAFARDILDAIRDRPISFEVISDDFENMGRQARKIAQWASNIYVKIPVTNTRGESSRELIRQLSLEEIKINVTAMLTLDQVSSVLEPLRSCPAAIVSLLGGRIADTGIDPVPIMSAAVQILKPYPNIELLWGSPREVLNVLQANDMGCHIITVTNDILKKLSMIGKNLDQLSLETIQMFYNDSTKAGYSL